MGSEQPFSSPTAHSRFSKVQYSHQTQTMLIRQPISTIRSIDTWIEKQKLYGHIYNSPSLFLCKDYKIDLNGACATSGIFIGKYQGIYKKTLKEEILHRSYQKHYFTQEQLWYFILFISKSASQIYQYGDKHLIGNIHPNNILMDRMGNYKIIVANYSYSLPNQQNHFKEYQINGDSYAYISPELIGFMYSTKYTGYPYFPRCLNQQAAQAFSFGITIIAMATLNMQLRKIYKRFSLGLNSRRITRTTLNGNPASSNKKVSFSKQTRIDQQASDYLNVLLLQIQKRYSTILFELIAGLVYHDPQIRLHIDRVYRQLLIPIEKNILLLDKQWIEQLKNQANDTENNLVDVSSKEICFKWARGESYILKQQNY